MVLWTFRELVIREVADSVFENNGISFKFIEGEFSDWANVRKYITNGVNKLISECQSITTVKPS
jgi:hypothetical protein